LKMHHIYLAYAVRVYLVIS